MNLPRWPPDRSTPHWPPPALRPLPAPTPSCGWPAKGARGGRCLSYWCSCWPTCFYYFFCCYSCAPTTCHLPPLLPGTQLLPQPLPHPSLPQPDFLVRRPTTLCSFRLPVACVITQANLSRPEIYYKINDEKETTSYSQSSIV